MTFRPLALLACGLLSAQAFAASVLYDDFNAGTGLDRTKWSESEGWRFVDDKGRLSLGRYLYGGTASSTGLAVESWNTSLLIGAAVKGLKGTVTATEIQQDETCAANTAVGQSSARLISSHFNIRAGGPVAGDRTGDVLAQIRLRRLSNSTDPQGTLQVQALLTQCVSADCNSSVNMPGSPVLMGTVPLGTAAKVQYTWDRKNNKVVFGWGAVSAEIAYTEDDSVAPSLLFANVSLRNEVLNCAGQRIKGGVAANFDNIYVSD